MGIILLASQGVERADREQGYERNLETEVTLSLCGVTISGKYSYFIWYCLEVIIHDRCLKTPGLGCIEVLPNDRKHEALLPYFVYHAD